MIVRVAVSRQKNCAEGEHTFLHISLPGKHSNRTLFAFNVEIIGIGLSGAWQTHEIRREYMNVDADKIQNERSPLPSFPRPSLFKLNNLINIYLLEYIQIFVVCTS